MKISIWPLLMPMNKWVKRVGVTLLSLYLIGCVVLYFAQDSVIFDPNVIDQSFQFREGEELEIEVEEGIYINALHVKREKPRGVVIYLHGNRGDIRRCLRQANSFVPSDYDFIMPDYRGYGKSDGEIYSQAQLYNDVQKVYDLAKTKYNEDQIVVAGYSLGSGMASYLAAHNKPSQLALIAPFVSISYVKDRYGWFIPDFLVKYNLNNYKNLQAVDCPVMLFHGTDDNVITYDNSEKLAAIGDNIELITMEGTGHRRAIFHDKLARWFAAL